MSDLLQLTRGLLTAKPCAPEDRPQAQHRYRLSGKGTWTKNADVFREWASEALGVNPDQIDEARAIYREHGCGDVQFTPDGRPIVTSREQFHRMAKASGMFHGRDGYGAHDEHGRHVATGIEGENRKRYLRDQLQRVIDGRPCDDSIMRMLMEMPHGDSCEF